MVHNTPLTSIHAELGAHLTEFGGWLMPLRYGSELAEHQAVRHQSGLFDLSHMGQLPVSGPAAGAFLDYALTGRLSDKPIGRAAYTMIVNGQGRIIDDLIVYRLDETEYLVVANAANREVVLAELMARTAGYEVSVSDRIGDWALIAVQGPAAAAILADAGIGDLATLKYYWARPDQLAGAEVLLARTGYTGEDGCEIFCRAEQAADIWRHLSRAGAAHQLVPCGLACRDTLRLEAGMPLYGHELSLDHTPYDAQLGRVVATTKADFVGRPALAAATSPQRLLVGLVGEGRRAPRAGYAVVDEAGDQVGVITSGALSPSLGYPIAFAYLDAGLATPGRRLLVDIRGSAAPVEVVETPFYRRAA